MMKYYEKKKKEAFYAYYVILPFSYTFGNTLLIFPALNTNLY